jgi:transcriptional regulator with AAA-type ATPase domain
VERIGGRKPVQLDVRVLAATNRDLPDDVAHGRFRKDLYFRLKAAEIRLPPLRERREDIRPLAEHVLSGVRPRRRLSEAAVAWLEEQPLPGNVRELESLIQVAALRAAGDTIEQTNLGGAAPAGAATAVAGASHSARIAANIFAQLLARVGSFDDLVWRPFADRRLPKDSVRELVRLAREHVGGATGRPVTTRDVARLFGIEARHKKLLDFLRNNGLRPSDQGVDGSPPAGA